MLPDRARPGVPLALAAAAAAAAVAAAALLARPAAAIVPEPGPYVWTTTDGREVQGAFGIMEVPEDRGVRSSRTLRLAYVRLPSTARQPGPPIVYLAGGPGASGIDSARGPRADLLLALREVADVVLLDQRGTGLSRPELICSKTWDHPLDEPLAEAAALAAVRQAGRACAERMRGLGVRLAAYNPREMADDVEALRRALGASKVSLLATSYGTRLALEVLRRHGAAVDRAVLLGVVGPDQELKLPAAADGVLAQIDMGDGRTLLDVLRARLAALARQPVRTTAVDVLTGKRVPVALGAFDLQLAIADHIGTADRLFALREIAVHLERGDWEPLAWDLLRQRKRWLGQVMPYAVVCAAGASEARRREAAEQAASSAVGRQLDFSFPDVCGALGVAPLGAALRQSVRSAVPVLVVSGTLDARTPAGNGEEVLRHLSRGVHLVIEGAGHGDDLLVGTPQIAARAATFLRGGTVAAGRLAALPLERRLPQVPATAVQTEVETLHGVEIPDPYRWLEDSRTPEVRLWTQAQNAFTDRALDVLPGRMELRRRLGELAASAGVGLPSVHGPRAVYRAVTGAATLSAIVVRDGSGAERVLADPRRFGNGESRAAVEPLGLSLDGRLLAFAVRRNGAEEVSVRFVAVDDGAALGDELPAGRYFGVAIAADGRGAYYGRERADGEGSRLYYHRFGTDPAADPVIFGEGYGRGSIVWGNLSDDGRWLVSHAVSGTRREIDVFLDRVQPAAAGVGASPPPSPPTGHDLSTRREVVSGIDAPFYGGVFGDKLVIHTTWEAPRGRIFVAPVDHPGREHWREIVPQQEHAVIQKVFGAGGRLLVEYLEDVHSRLAVFDLDGRHLGDVPLPGPGSLGGFSGRFDEPDVYFSFSTFHLPGTIYRYDLAAGRLAVWRQPKGGLDLDAYEVKQLWVVSKDGTRVPMFVVHGRGMKLDGSHPTVVTAYGGFATSLTPEYRPEVAWWVESGGVWAVANVRGGGELGAEWHQAAVREHKQRSIDDLIAAAQGLIDAGYTRPGQLAAWGHSNGGLLVAAAMVQRPDLFRAVVSTHPLLDMLRYNKFLAARFWLPEYGSPDRADAFPYLRAYSPYQNVAKGVRYPAVYLETSYGDTQVDPLHARKMAARLQAVAVPDRPVLLRHHQDAGHGAEGVTLDQRIDELVDILSFLRWQLGPSSGADPGVAPSARASAAAPGSP
ncbi:MAG TPA: alpha/beta fold hydrolase [Thermoanaerobaculia bacterium]|nr:alpha/beta fold hydrolase [Thermoanaerobaculia bacterium]